MGLRKMILLWVGVFIASSIIDLAYGMAAWFAKDYCLTPLEPGEVIMGDVTIVSEERRVQFVRLVNGTIEEMQDTYEPGEIVTAHMEDNQGQFVLEVGGGATFIDTSSGCDRSRIAENDAQVLLPLSGEVSLKAGWASGHMQVKITPTISLKPSREVSNPRFKVELGKLRGAMNSLNNDHSVHSTIFWHLATLAPLALVALLVGVIVRWGRGTDKSRKSV